MRTGRIQDGATVNRPDPSKVAKHFLHFLEAYHYNNMYQPHVSAWRTALDLESIQDLYHTVNKIHLVWQLMISVDRQWREYIHSTRACLTWFGFKKNPSSPMSWCFGLRGHAFRVENNWKACAQRVVFATY